MRKTMAAGLATLLVSGATLARADPEDVLVAVVSRVNGTMIVERKNRDIWLIDVGAGCPARLLYKKKWVGLDWSSEFASMGSQLILQDDEQRCPILKARQIGWGRKHPDN